MPDFSFSVTAPKEDIDVTLKAFGAVTEKLKSGIYASETVEY